MHDEKTGRPTAGSLQARWCDKTIAWVFRAAGERVEPSGTGNGSKWGTDRQSSAPVVPEHAAQHYPRPNNDPAPSGNRRDPGNGVALCGPLFLLDARPVAVVQPAGKQEGGLCPVC